MSGRVDCVAVLDDTVRPAFRRSVPTRALLLPRPPGENGPPGEARPSGDAPERRAWIARRRPVPADAARADAPPPTPASATTDDRPRVLIADEDAVTVRVLRHRFERDGLAVDTVADGAEALARLHTAPPDVALLNVALVGVDGFEILRRVRAGEAGPPDLPLALMCWAGNDALVVRGFALDADDIVVRPFSLAEVSARVRRLARRTVRTAAASAAVAPTGRP